jgi:hypothetical protein
VGVPLQKGLTVANRIDRALRLLLGGENPAEPLHVWFPDCSEASRAMRESELLCVGLEVVAHFPLLEISKQEQVVELQAVR